MRTSHRCRHTRLISRKPHKDPLKDPLKVSTFTSAASVPSAPAAYKDCAGRPFLEGHTYLLAIAWLKDQVNHPGSAALHSADRSWIESPSGASAGQFLLVFFAVCKCCAFH
jgi:hypothetical protein